MKNNRLLTGIVISLIMIAIAIPIFYSAINHIAQYGRQAEFFPEGLDYGLMLLAFVAVLPGITLVFSKKEVDYYKMRTLLFEAIIVGLLALITMMGGSIGGGFIIPLVTIAAVFIYLFTALITFFTTAFSRICACLAVIGAFIVIAIFAP